MTQARMTDFEDIWCVDCEFQAADGERPRPICLVARELRSGRLIQLWEEDLRRHRAPPYAIGKHSVFVAYYASAELGCHLALGWPLPVYVLDLFVEFRVLTNGLPTLCGTDLLGALVSCGLDGIAVVDKDRMRHLAMRGGPWTVEERTALLDYCAADVRALAQLLARLLPMIDVPRALLRGRYMKAAAHMEYTGIPINTEALTTLRDHWAAIQDELIARVNVGYGVYERRTFKADRFEQWLQTRGIPWPRSAAGALALDQDTFREMARAYPAIQPIHELRTTLSQMRLEQLAVGRDGRNRTLLSAFRATTGRNQPSTTKCIFGPAVWVRQLITPTPGWGMAYIDWEQQEFGIAAALSGDTAMRTAYESGDPYLAFAQQAGAIPPNGTRATHGAMRDVFKACALAVQYGMGPLSLATRLGHPPSVAHDLLRMHRQTYPIFWAWSDRAVDHAMLYNQLQTVFGWTVRLGPSPDPTIPAGNPRSLRNFPMQANGAEILRLACCWTTEWGIRVCAPVHDALLIEAPVEELNHAVAETQRAMAEASRAVLGGFQLRSEAKVFRYPDHYQDERGARMWSIVWSILEAYIGVPMGSIVAD